MCAATYYNIESKLHAELHKPKSEWRTLHAGEQAESFERIPTLDAPNTIDFLSTNLLEFKSIKLFSHLATEIREESTRSMIP